MTYTQIAASITALILLSAPAFADSAGHEIKLSGTTVSRCSIPAAPTGAGGINANLQSSATSGSQVIVAGLTEESGIAAVSNITLKFAGVWCNKPANFTLSSANGGLLHGSENDTMPSGFTNKVNYTAKADWPNAFSITLNSNTKQVNSNSGSSNAADLLLLITTTPDTKRLVAGDYTDTLTFSIDPGP
jgi:hypothetical protein